jgi:UDP-glucose 4-epimerase
MTCVRVLVTGSAGHLGEALVRTLRDLGMEPIGLDILACPFTTHVGSLRLPFFAPTPESRRRAEKRFSPAGRVEGIPCADICRRALSP